MALTLLGCATPYQSMGFSGGYSSSALDDDTYLVTVKVNAFTDASTAYSYFHRRAAEICTYRGFKSYQVLDSDKSSKKSIQSSGNSLIVVEKSRVFGRIQCLGKAQQASRDSTKSGWKVIVVSGGDTVFVSLERLRRESPTLVDSWIERRFAAPQNSAKGAFARSQERVLADCERIQMETQAFVRFAADGKIVDAVTEQQPPSASQSWVSPPPGSTGEAIVRSLCRLSAP